MRELQRTSRCIVSLPAGAVGAEIAVISPLGAWECYDRAESRGSLGPWEHLSYDVFAGEDYRFTDCHRGHETLIFLGNLLGREPSPEQFESIGHQYPGIFKDEPSATHPCVTGKMPTNFDPRHGVSSVLGQHQEKQWPRQSGE